MAFPV
ncbi:hypothetical protein VCHC42A1_3139, partial [Vibrio cholerae HC-42A1]